ncbi:hypothetical protein EYF80_028539 [Liparis tanakae]|uniref:Uncharacterized protein n=1 Tax=Liparis tanakae TaxID=230148 RepID=A0A4Z2H8Q5_9TELE|nr:hypothetical protein EYF80_028539 [Liparis tanakae]
MAHGFFRGGKRRCATPDDRTDPTGATTTEDSRLPPEMKRVQRAARTAGAKREGVKKEEGGYGFSLSSSHLEAVK